MHVPRGKPVYENLGTSFVNVAALLSDLRVNSFTGYVYIGFPSYDGYVFFNNGRIVNALEQTDDSWKTNIDAVDSLLVRAQHRGGTVSVFDHPPTVIAAIAGAIDGQVVHKGLTSDFTNLPRLLERLSRDAETIYYTEVQLEQSAGTGLIYSGGGRTDAVFSTGEGETILGEPALREMLSRANDIGATINVYRPAAEQRDILFGDSRVEGRPPHRAAIPNPPKEVAAPAPQQPPPAPEPSHPMESSSSGATLPPFSAGTRPLGSAALTELMESIPPTADTAAQPQTPPPAPPRIELSEPSPNTAREAAPSAPLPPVSEPSARTEPESALDERLRPPSPPTFVPSHPLEAGNQPGRRRESLGEVVSFMGEVLAVAEKSAVGHVKDGGEFATALREGLLEVTDRYPFLDPFAGEFEYRNGALRFNGDAQPVDFAAGACEALQHAVVTLTRRLGDRSLPKRVAHGLRELGEGRSREFQQFDINALLEEISRQA